MRASTSSVLSACVSSAVINGNITTKQRPFAVRPLLRRRYGLHAVVQEVSHDREAPIPMPVCDLVVELSACRNRSNTYGRNSSGMPTPVSRTGRSSRSRRPPLRHPDRAARRCEFHAVRYQVPS